MGIGFVLIIWAVIASVMAGIGMVVLGGATALATRGVRTISRQAAIAVATLFSFVCVGWAGGVFVFQALVNELILNRDLGMGDSWHCPITNGYQILFIDITDHGIVYNPKTQLSKGGVHDREGAIFGVRQLQLSGEYILGGRDTAAIPSSSSDHVDSFFVLDTRTGTRRDFERLESLKDEAASRGVKLQLEPIYDVYSKHRFTYFDVFAGILFIVPPLTGFVALIWWIIRLRRTPQFQPQPV
jgi:hypothetical protein